MDHQQHQLRKQNELMSKTIQSYLQQIHKQKVINQQRQNQIESLLKFNQRLLNIIQTQMTNNKKDNASLMPISEKSQRQSDLMNPLNSLIKTKKTLAARSEKGTKSVIQSPGSYMSKLQQLGKHLQTSEFANSQDGQDSYLFSVRTKKVGTYNNTNSLNTYNNKNIVITNGGTKQQQQYPPSSYQSTKPTNDHRKYSQLTTKLQLDISNEMKKMQSCAEKNKTFYQQKINQLKNLSEKIGTYKPQDKFNQIAKKIPMSAGTADLVKKAMMARKL